MIVYKKIQAKYSPFLTLSELEKLGDEVTEFGNELKKTTHQYWATHSRWQKCYVNYLKNMTKRADLASIHDHVQISINPVIITGLRGERGSGKLILGNNGTRDLIINASLALPSTHWGLIFPDSQLVSELFNLKKFKIPSKQTKNISLTVKFPNSLSFNNYKGILKIKPNPINLLPETK
jgi:hypothetical protein